MHEILKSLPPDSLVLDLGCAEGSFSRESTASTVVRFDRDRRSRGDGTLFVQGDSARLPFADHVFAAVISNHSLEHFDDLGGTLLEIGRVVTPGGSLFASVPDASTLTDKLYRWLARGGGHVNPFTSPDALAATIERSTGLKHRATRVLYSSLSFLNRRTAPRPIPKRLILLGAGYEWSLFLFVWLSRRVDRWFGTRTSILGWAFFFGNVPESIDTGTWRNVCIRCGSGCPAAVLKSGSMAASVVPGIRLYRCPDCGALNPFADD